MKEDILQSLEPMFRRAEAEGLWFNLRFYRNQDIWLSPAELRAQIEEGNYLLVPVDRWQLRPPAEHQMELMKKADAAMKEVQEVGRRIIKESHKEGS